MRLADLLAAVDPVAIHVDDTPVERAGVLGVVRAVTRDSREVGADDVFVAIVGASFDGHEVADGFEAAAVVAERPVPVADGVPRVLVRDSRAAFAHLAARLHGDPARTLPVVGITGTNGKTTVTTLLDEALRRIGWVSARLGTTGLVLDGEGVASPLTTPEAPQLHGFFARARDLAAARGVPGAAVMEVSSIGLAQRRVEALPFHTAVFTTFGRDHLDFHGTLDAYRAAKASLFTDHLREAGVATGHAPGDRPRAVVNGDDPAWPAMQSPADRWVVGTAEAFGDVDVRLTVVQSGPGLRITAATPVGTTTFSSRLVGGFNASNLGLALAAGLTLGAPLDKLADALAEVPAVRGRLERVAGVSGPAVYVDYAHTPDALRTVLAALRPAVRGRLWVVFGCGGDRDAGKRPAMGAAAADGADVVVLTSDNPRSESPEAIAAQVLQGVPEGRALVELDRAAAIARAVHEAASDDLVLVAGKGHETTQVFATGAVPFDDREVARAALLDRLGGGGA